MLNLDKKAILSDNDYVLDTMKRGFTRMTKEYKKSGAGLLIFLGWLMYATSYLGKVNYSANIAQIIDFYGVTKAEAGLAPTFFFFAYGIGQVVNGFLCSRYNIKWTIFASLVLSGVINLTIAMTTTFGIVKWLWLVNGFVMSILWPTLIRLMTESLSTRSLGKSSVVIGTTVAVGTGTIYGLSSIFAMFDKFKLAFYAAAFAILAVAFIWILIFDRATGMARQEKEILDKHTVSEIENREKSHFTGSDKKFFFFSVGIFCFCAVGCNLVKDGLTTWVPSILKDEFGIADSISILLTLCLPIVAIFGNATALRFKKRIPDYIVLACLIFVTIGIFTGGIIGSLSLKSVFTILASLILASFFASTLNSLITSIFPLFMRDRINSGLFAGILNGFCYLGSTISSYGLGFIADKAGWIAVFYFLLGFCALICFVCVIYMFVKALLKKNIYS